MFLYRLIRFITFPFCWLTLRLRNKDAPWIFHEKMGRPTDDRPKGDVIWIHCDSIVESKAAIRELMANMPNKTILLTCNANDAPDVHYDANVIRQYAPADMYMAVRRFLQFWEPAAAIRLGSELRPNQLALLKKNNIPSFLINGEISGRSYRRWKRARRLARRVMRCFTFVWALDNKQTLRLANMGARDIKSQELLTGGNKIREILYEIKQYTK